MPRAAKEYLKLESLFAVKMHQIVVLLRRADSNAWHSAS